MKNSQSVNTLNKNEIANLALEHLKELVFVFDERGAILYANPCGAGYFGMKTDELAGKELKELLPSDQVHAELEVISRVIEKNKSISYEHTWLIKGGNFHFSTHKQPIGDKKNENTVVLSISTDITEKVELEQEMRLQDDNYRELLEATQNSVWEEDFSEVKNYLDSIKEDGVTDLGDYFDKNPDAL